MTAHENFWLKWPETPTFKKDGELEPCMRNVALIMQHHQTCVGVLAYDKFREKKVKLKIPPWGGCEGGFTNAEIPRVRFWLQDEFGINVSTEIIDHALCYVCDMNAYDSLKEEIYSFQWDGIDRLSTFFHIYFGAEDSPYTRAVSRSFLISLIARAIEPGCKVDTMVILEGLQGVRKSSGLRALAGPKFFSDTMIDFDSKDAMYSIHGVWIQELPELDSFYKSEQTSIKAFLTKQEDRFRPAYAREMVNFIRRTVFVGTTNEVGYLSDSTGARRFLPINCAKVDVEAIERDRELIFAEARTAFLQGEAWWYSESSDTARLAQEQQAARRSDDAWLEQISEWIATRPASVLANGVTEAQVLTECMGLELNRLSGRKESARVVAILKEFGWSKTIHAVRRGNARVRVWLPPHSQTLAIDSGPDLGED